MISKYKSVYVIVAYRHGVKHSHGYVSAVCNSKLLAKFVSKSHEISRAGKYCCEIITIRVDNRASKVKLFTYLNGYGEGLKWDTIPFTGSSHEIFSILKNKDLEKELLEANEYWYCYPDDTLPLIRDTYEKSMRNSK